VEVDRHAAIRRSERTRLVWAFLGAFLEISISVKCSFETRKKKKNERRLLDLLDFIFVKSKTANNEYETRFYLQHK